MISIIWGSQFIREKHTIEAVDGIGGSIEPKGLITVASGETQAFTIYPDQGYIINQVIVDGKNIHSDLKRSGTSFRIQRFNFENVSDSHTIMVSFVPVMRIITASATANGSIAPSGDIFVNDGDAI